MANPSILAAFERMWFHIINALNSKASIDHNHDDQYYTESEVDAIVSAADAHIRTKADLEHNHDVQYEKIGSAKKIVADLIANGQIGGLETESEIISETLAVVEDGTCQIQLPVNLTTGSYYLYIDGTKYEMFCKGGAYLDADGMSIQASGNTVSITWHTSAPDSVTVSMTRAVEIIHTIDAQYIPKLKNELVIEESTTLTYEFDGDPADRFVYGDMLVHISNDTPDVSNFVKAIGVTPTGESLEVTKDFVTISTPEDSNIAGITIPSLNSMIAALVVYGDNANDLPVGLYLACTPTGYCSYLELEQIHRTIDSKFLPDGLASEEFVASAIDTKQDKITGAAGDFVVIGDDGNLTTKTILDASEVKF